MPYSESQPGSPPMRFTHLAFISLISAFLHANPAVADSFLTNDEIMATQINRDLSGTTRSGKLLKIVFATGGQATASFETTDSTEVSYDGWWKLRENGKLCFKIETVFRGAKKCVKIRRNGSNFQLYGIGAGKSIFDYSAR